MMGRMNRIPPHHQKDPPKESFHPTAYRPSGGESSKHQNEKTMNHHHHTAHTLLSQEDKQHGSNRRRRQSSLCRAALRLSAEESERRALYEIKESCDIRSPGCIHSDLIQPPGTGILGSRRRAQDSRHRRSHGILCK